MRKRVVYILSSMRSGSTLLKALLATRPDISDLPEVPPRSMNIVLNNVKQDIVVIKSPASYFETDYPNISIAGEKKIIIVRNPYDTVISLHKMNLINNWERIMESNESSLLRYWQSTYANLLNLSKKSNVLVVKYENITRSPLTETQRIFEFVNTAYKKGTNTYFQSKNYKWKWGMDDGGELIKTLRVQNRESKFLNTTLIKLIHENMIIQCILKKFGYSAICPILFSHDQQETRVQQN